MGQNDLVKTLRMNYLFDFYQSLLTNKQKNYLELFYLQDYSLSEIADTFEAVSYTHLTLPTSQDD